jgi:hypothetical protein
MDTQFLVNKLSQVFCNTNRQGVQYSEVWLTEANLGGLYRNGKYVLHVKAVHPVISCFDETVSIIQLLKKEAPEAAKRIWTVKIYDANDVMVCGACEEGSIEVYNEEYAPCAAVE